MNARLQRVDLVRKTQRLANGAERTELFDFLGRVQQVDEPDGSSLYYRYDERGFLRQLRDSSGERVDYRRTPEVMEARTARCETQIVFDAGGFPARLTTRIDGHEWSIDYRRDARGAPTALRYPGATDWLELGAQLACGRERYARFAAPYLELSNGARATETWAEAHVEEPGTKRRLERITHRDAAGVPRVDQRYDYDASGRIAAAGSQRFAYDAEGRLVACDEVGYVFDAEGLLRSIGARELDYAGAPCVARAGGVRFDYDALGRRSARHDAAGTQRYRYNLFGQLAAVTLADGATVRYLYDGFGRLVGREHAGGVTYYVVDVEGRRIADVAANGAIVRSYLWFGAQCIGAVDGVCGAPLAQSFHRVHGGTLAAIGDARGSLEPVSHSDPYGADALPIAGVPGYANLFGDPDTGLLHAGSRWLDPSIGQFISADSWFATQALDRLPAAVRTVLDALPGGTAIDLDARRAYDWCARDPVNYCDPNGHNPVWLLLSAFSTLVWSMQMTSFAFQMEVIGLLIFILSTVPGVMFLWNKELWTRLAPWSGMAPVNASYRLHVPIAFPLNSIWNVGGRAFTIGNVIFTNGLDELEKTSKRDLIECANAATYVAAAEEVAANVFRARSPHARGTGTADAAGGALTGVAVTVPAGVAAAAIGDVFALGDWLSIRLRAGGDDELRQITGAPLTLDRALPDAFFNQAVDVVRLDNALVHLQKGDVHAVRSLKFIRGQALHIASQLPAEVPTEGLAVAEYMPAGLRAATNADALRQAALIRVAVAADQALFAPNDFVRVRAGGKQFPRVVARRRGSRDLILDAALPAPATPADYLHVEVAKLAPSGPAIPNQTGAADRVNVGTIADLRKGDGLTVANAGAGAVTDRRIVEQVLLACPIAALPNLLRNVPLTVDLLDVDAGKQASGKNSTTTQIDTTAGQAGRFAKDQSVRVRRAPSTDFFTTLAAVDAAANKLTLAEPLPAAFPNLGPVTVNLLTRTKGLTAENTATGTPLTVKVDQPGTPANNALLRIRDTAAAQPAVFRVVTAAPTVVAQLDAGLPATHTANLSVQRFAPVAASVRSNASAPLVQLRLTLRAAPNPYRQGDELHLDQGGEAYGKVLAAPVGLVVELEDPVELELGERGVKVQRIAPTGKNTNDAKLLESLLMIPSDPGEELVTRRRALQLHEMRHVFQYAVLGPFFFSLPIPWLLSLGFNDGTGHDVNKYLRHITLGGLDSLFAWIWGIVGDKPSAGDADGDLADASLRVVQFPADADAAKIGTFTPDAPCEVKKGDYTTYNKIVEQDVAQRRVTLKFPLESDKFAQNDRVNVSVSPFEKTRATVHRIFGLNLGQLWAESLPPSWFQVLMKLLDRDNWIPFLGLYWINWLRAGDQSAIGFEQDAAFQSGDLYTNFAIGSPTELFVGQFARVLAFISGRGGNAAGEDVATGLSRVNALEILAVEPKGVTAPGKPTDFVFGSVPASNPARVRFRERFYMHLNDRVENAVGAFFAASQPGVYELHVGGELTGDVKATLWFFGAGFQDDDKITVKALEVSPSGALFETETPRFTIKGDPKATYTIQYRGAAPAKPLTFDRADPLRATVPVGALGPHTLEIKATYRVGDSIFHGPGQLEPIGLTAADVSNVCQSLPITVTALAAPAIGPVQAGKQQTFQMPIAPASVRVTTGVPAGAATRGSVLNGTGRPATLTFIAPNKVTAATDVKLEMVFGTPGNTKTIPVTVRVTP